MTAKGEPQHHGVEPLTMPDLIITVRSEGAVMTTAAQRARKLLVGL